VGVGLEVHDTESLILTVILDQVLLELTDQSKSEKQYGHCRDGLLGLRRGVMQ